jgi:hypothetical protein
MMLQGHNPLCQEVMAGALQETKPHGFYRMLPELFHLICGGPLSIGSILLRPVWIEVNGKLSYKNLPTWGIL